MIRDWTLALFQQEADPPMVPGRRHSDFYTLRTAKLRTVGPSGTDKPDITATAIGSAVQPGECAVVAAIHHAGCPSARFLSEIDTGENCRVSQPMGSGWTGYRADRQALAPAGPVLRDALGRRPDLVIRDRLDSIEADNGGCATELPGD